MFEIINPIDIKTRKFTDPGSQILNKCPKYTIFLAGPCPRTDYLDDWRYEAVAYLKEAGFDGLIFNPTNSSWDSADSTYLEKQIAWEVEAMAKSNLVVFWIPRDLAHPAFTTNIEIGQFLNRKDIERIVVGLPDWAIKNDYLKIRLNMLNKTYDSDLRSLMYNTIKELKEHYDR